MKTLAVAANTLREAVRDRILYLLLFFAVLMIVSSKLLSLLAPGTANKIIVDIGLASINFFSVLIAVFMGIGLVSREIERRTIYAVVSKPLRRESFVFGKFLGMSLAISFNHAVMVLFFIGTLRLWGAPFTTGHAMALTLALLEAVLLLSFALLYSALASPILASMFTLVTFVVGHLVDGLELLLGKVPEGALRGLVRGVYWLFPNLELLNLKNQVVFPEGAGDVPTQFLMGLIYGVSYTVAVLTLAALAYRRKDFL